MYKRITIISILVFTFILLYFADKYNAVNDLKFAAAKDYVTFYESTADQFWQIGMIICFISWVWVDVVIIKTKQLFWLWLPFLFIVIVAFTNSYQEEQLFHFKKANGLWKGGFSLSYFFSIAIILIAGFVLLINYFGFKKYFEKENEKLTPSTNIKN